MTSQNRLSVAKPSTPLDEFEVIEDADEVAAASDHGRKWKILVVDDDPEVHKATRFALALCEILGRPLALIFAYSAAEGRAALEETQDIAVVLLDVVMEGHDSGLRFVEWMREHRFANQRIILRTGQPGYAPELAVIRDYDINDYRSKSELTQTHLISSITTAIRMFVHLLKLEDQRDELENFAYALAHDFKQPIRQITTFSQMISRRISGSGDSEVLQYLAFLGLAASRLGELVDVMSQYTLLNQPPELADVDLSAVVESVRTSLAPLLAECGGRIDAPKRLPMIRGHATLMNQALQNLVINGLHYNTSQAPRVAISAKYQDGQCAIDVRDNGIGIEVGHLTEIFKPLVRLHNAADYPGSGLGLTLARKAVLAQGGSIWCDSLLGRGSVFHVRVPVAHRPTASGVKRVRPAARGT